MLGTAGIFFFVVFLLASDTNATFVKVDAGENVIRDGTPNEVKLSLESWPNDYISTVEVSFGGNGLRYYVARTTSEAQNEKGLLIKFTRENYQAPRIIKIITWTNRDQSLAGKTVEITMTMLIKWAQQSRTQNHTFKRIIGVGQNCKGTVKDTSTKFKS